MTAMTSSSTSSTTASPIHHNTTSDIANDIPTCVGSTTEKEELEFKASPKHASPEDNGVVDVKAGAASASTTTNSNNATDAKHVSAPQATATPMPLLKGTLSYNLETRRHLMRGMWNYETADTKNPSTQHPPPQRFELIRNLTPEEDVSVLPTGGTFNGSFSLVYYHTNSKGRKKERSQVVTESGVHLTFTTIPTASDSAADEEEENEFTIEGKGTNQFGVFQLVGTATLEPPSHEDTTYKIIMRKSYITPTPPIPLNEPSKKRKKTLKRKQPSAIAATPSVPLEALPEVAESFPTGVVCLRGRLVKECLNDISGTQMIHKIHGIWSEGLDQILSSPSTCHTFDYEHRTSSPNPPFPLTGRYSGLFVLNATKTKIAEKELHLKFIPNKEGYYNIQGKGWNVFGKYSISGVLKRDWEITLFRHFTLSKSQQASVEEMDATASNTTYSKGVGAATTNAMPVSQDKDPPTTSSTNTPLSNTLSLVDIKIPPQYQTTNDKPPPITPPLHGNYSAVSRGIFKINTDGTHTCGGKWAITREHFSNQQTSTFHFGLEHAQALLSLQTSSNSSTKLNPFEAFPMDSTFYKGSFKMRRGSTKYTSIIDRQICLTFVENTAGSFNVHGVGSNSIGRFTLIGTLIPSIMNSSNGDESEEEEVLCTSGQVELYRMYPVVPATTPSNEKKSSHSIMNHPPQTLSSSNKNQSPSHSISSTESTSNTHTNNTPLVRSSSRTSKPPIHLSEDNPTAITQRIYDKCQLIHKFLKEKDALAGGYFALPVDPVALGIPNYTSIIKTPMDLQSIEQTMLKKKHQSTFSYMDFETKMRLVFENAMMYNEDTTHAVHIAARNLLTLFCMKFKDVEKEQEKLNRIRTHGHKMGDTIGGKVLFDTVGSSATSNINHSITSGGNARKQNKGTSSCSISRGKELPSSSKRDHSSSHNHTSSSTDHHHTKKSSRKRDADSSNLREGNSKRRNNSSGNSHGNILDKEMFVTRGEFDTLKQQFKAMQSMLESFQKNMTTVNGATVVGTNTNSGSSSNHNTSSSSSRPIPQPPQPPPTHTSPLREKSLTLQEQEVLTESINTISADKLPGVIQIIRESTKLNGDEEEIDLEIDQLDTMTQRKLQRFVMENVKGVSNSTSGTGTSGGGSNSGGTKGRSSDRRKDKKKGKKSRKEYSSTNTSSNTSNRKTSTCKSGGSSRVSNSSTTAVTSNTSSSKHQTSQPSTATNHATTISTNTSSTSTNNNNNSNQSQSSKVDNSSSFFSFGSNNKNNLNQDSDDDDDSSSTSSSHQPLTSSLDTTIKKKDRSSADADSFLLPDPKESNGSSDSEQEDYTKSLTDTNSKTSTTATNWNKMKQTTTSNTTKTPPQPSTSTIANSPGKNSASSDSSSSDEDPLWSSARAQSQKNSSLEQIRTTQKQKLHQSTTQKQTLNFLEAANKLKQQTQEKQSSLKIVEEEKLSKVENLRKEMRETHQSIEATVDLEEQRQIMKKYEQSLVGGDYDFGSASPSSDFGF